MASLSELASVMSTSPAQAFRQEDIASQQYQLQSQGLQDQAKELADDRKQALQGAATGQPLAGMTNQLLPGAKLVGSDGLPTVAGQMNNMLLGAQGLAKQGKQLISSANSISDPVQRSQVLAEGRRMVQNAQADVQKAQKLQQDTMNDSIYAAATAKNSQEWDNAVKAYQSSGLPLPQGIPLDYSPENVKKIAALAPAALQSKINNDLIKRQQDARAEERAERVARAAIANGRDGDFGKEYKEVKGQAKGLTQYLPVNVVKDLGAKEIPAVASRIESSKLTNELAEAVAKNPKSAGLAASFAKTFDKYLPERYDANTEAPEALKSKLDSAIDSWTPKGATPDEISEARSIAKKAVDVINARALAASGGSRMLVSEIKMQKDVIGLEGLSPKSAVKVYSDLAESDLKSLQKYGINRDQIKGFDKKLSETPKAPEAKPAEAKSGIPPIPAGVPSTAKYSPSQGKWWWEVSPGKWESK
jgi:hypothetical protein